MKENRCEALQISLFYVLVAVFSLDRAQNTTWYTVLEQLTNRNASATLYSHSVCT